MKPEGYPLPWCEAVGVAYWRINRCLCSHSRRWAEWQKHKSMSKIIPVIDRLVPRWMNSAPASA